jgi:hypothetical protein
MDSELIHTLPFPFRSELDRRLALEGPAAIFTLDARGQLQFDAARSRESWDRLEKEMSAEDPSSMRACPCLFRDRETGWVQFVLSTSETLCRHHPRAEVRIFPDSKSALDALHSVGVPPVLEGSLAKGPE